MPLDPAIKGLLAFAQAGQDSGRPTVEQARSRLRALTIGMRSAASVVPVRSAEDLTIHGRLPVRVYRPIAEPALDSPIPTVIFFHGGGFVIGDLDTHDHLSRMICREVGAVVISVGYRLAPEAAFPAALEDCLTATRWASEQVHTLGGDPQRVGLAGDSAGANLAAVVAQVCRDEQGPPIAAQLLICPITDLDAEAAYPSRLENADGYFLTAADMRWFGQSYLASPDLDVSSPRISPLCGALAGLAPAVVVTAEFDPLRDEGEAYAHAMAAAGVAVTLHRFDTLIHGFFDFTSLSPVAADAVVTMAGSFRKLLAAQG